MHELANWVIFMRVKLFCWRYLVCSWIASIRWNINLWMAKQSRANKKSVIASRNQTGGFNYLEDKYMNDRSHIMASMCVWAISLGPMHLSPPATHLWFLADIWVWAMISLLTASNVIYLKDNMFTVQTICFSLNEISIHTKITTAFVTNICSRLLFVRKWNSHNAIQNLSFIFFKEQMKPLEEAYKQWMWWKTHKMNVGVWVGDGVAVRVGMGVGAGGLRIRTRVGI